MLLRAPNPLSPGERELIAAYVSGLNECDFCCRSHSAFAAAQLDAGMSLVDQVRADLDSAPIAPKLRALLRIAGAVRQGGRAVTAVLIAAAFCMYNRYVDGLGTLAPRDDELYAQVAGTIVEAGYTTF